MACVFTSSFQILWNGDKSESFFPSRGIRQGDPLSPYIFVICMEVLSHFILDSVHARYRRPVRAGSRGPRISHIIFFNDLLLFVEASVDQMCIIKEYLNQFCAIFGHKVNDQKTNVCFSKNVVGAETLSIT